MVSVTYPSYFSIVLHIVGKFINEPLNSTLPMNQIYVASTKNVGEKTND